MTSWHLDSEFYLVYKDSFDWKAMWIAQIFHIVRPQPAVTRVVDGFRAEQAGLHWCHRYHRWAPMWACVAVGCRYLYMYKRMAVIRYPWDQGCEGSVGAWPCSNHKSRDFVC